MRKNLIAFVFVVLVAVSMLGSLSFGAVAQDGTNELHNETHAVGNDTSAVYLDVVNTTDENGTAQNVTATFYGIDENGTETEVDSVVLSATENETATHEVTADPDTYDEYRVVVTGDYAELIDSGLIGRLGGGGWFSGSLTEASLMGIPIWFIVVILVIAFIFSRED